MLLFYTHTLLHIPVPLAPGRCGETHTGILDTTRTHHAAATAVPTDRARQGQPHPRVRGGARRRCGDRSVVRRGRPRPRARAAAQDDASGGRGPSANATASLRVDLQVPVDQRQLQPVPVGLALRRPRQRHGLHRRAHG